MKQHKKSSIERSQDSLFSKLRKLRECGILKHSINPEDESSDFEILEFYGDSVLYERIAFFLLKTRRFMCPDLLSKIRQECINNKNLALCFDTLNLRDITSYSSSDKVLLIKAKADVIEAIIGELAEAIERGDSVVRDAEVKSVLEELLAFISYNGEKEFFAMGSPALAQTNNNTSPPRPSQSVSPQKPFSPSYKSSSPQKPLSPSKSSSFSSSSPSVSLPYATSAKQRIASKQNLYKNNISPSHKASKKHQQATASSSSLSSLPSSSSSFPSSPSNPVDEKPTPSPYFSILTHATPQPSLSLPPFIQQQQLKLNLVDNNSSSSSFSSSPFPSSAPTSQLTPKAMPSFHMPPPLSSHSSSSPSPSPASLPSSSLPPPSSSSLPSYPSSEVYLGGRNVAVYTAT